MNVQIGVDIKQKYLIRLLLKMYFYTITQDEYNKYKNQSGMVTDTILNSH